MCVSFCMSLCVCRAGRDEEINRGREGGREGGWVGERGGRKRTEVPTSGAANSCWTPCRASPATAPIACVQ